MSNNEEKMREENLIAVCRENGCTHRQAANIRDFVSQTTASKQREIDALNRQVLELSATVERMRDALLQINLAASATVCNQEWIARRAETALSLSPSTALRDYVNEEVAKSLEGMLEEHRRFPHDGMIRIVEAALNERRNRK